MKCWIPASRCVWRILGVLQFIGQMADFEYAEVDCGASMEDEIIGHYSKTGYEDNRLEEDIAPLEFIRTKEIIARYLSGGDAKTIIDIGGGTGAYSFWLTQMGHTVHLLDVVPRHIDIAKEKAARLGVPLASIQLGDARSLPHPSHSADIVLLMGPLYHLIEVQDRQQALREAGRVLKTKGMLFCAAISRFASMLDGFRSRLFDDPEFEGIVDQDLKTGQHRNPREKRDYFTTAYFHRPEELVREITAAGFICDKIVGIEGPLSVLPDLKRWIVQKDRYCELALKYAKALEDEVYLVGASFHLLAVARKQ